MRDTIFRLNDIRGEIGRDMETTDMAAIAHAIATYLTLHDSVVSRVIVGRDGRLHSPAIAEIMLTVFAQHGLEIIDLGICTTPVVQFMMHKLPSPLAVMITASHNGPTYNGCKIFYNNKPLCGTAIQALRPLARAFQHSSASPARPSFDTKLLRNFTQDEREKCVEIVSFSEQWVRGLHNPNAVQRYIAWLCAHFAHLQGWEGNIVFDCGSGATAAVIPQLITAMKWPHAQVLYGELDGRFPFHEADPVVPDNMRDLAQRVVASDALCGIGFDGDGDRMGMVTQTGCHVRGDRLLALFAYHILQKSSGERIVFDNKCSHMVDNLIIQNHGIPHRGPSGHSLIRSAMEQQGAVFGGELSCHFFFADHYFGYDDGIYAALRIIDLLARNNTTLEEALAAIPRPYSTQEWRIPYADEHKEMLVSRMKNYATRHHAIRDISLLDGIRMTTDHGWILLRASQTQPALCLCSEAYSAADVEPLGAIVQDFLQTHALWDATEPEFTSWLNTAHTADQSLC